MTTVAIRSQRSRPRPEPGVYEDGQPPAGPQTPRPTPPPPSPQPDTAQPQKLPSRSMREAMRLPQATITHQQTPPETRPEPVSERPKVKPVAKTQGTQTSEIPQPRAKQKIPTRLDRPTLARQTQQAVDSALLYSLLHCEDLQTTRQRAADAIADHFHLPHQTLPPIDDLQKIESRLETLQNQIDTFANVVQQAQPNIAAPPQPTPQPQVQLEDQTQPMPAPVPAELCAPVDPPDTANAAGSRYDDLLRRLLEENIKLSRHQDD